MSGVAVQWPLARMGCPNEKQGQEVYYARNQRNVPLERHELGRLNPYATIGLSCVQIRFLRRLIVVTQFRNGRSF
jgi:hypothetical protein